MSAYTKTLEKQNEILREEVRIHAQAVDTLSERLAVALNELQALQPKPEEIVLDDNRTEAVVASEHKDGNE